MTEEVWLSGNDPSVLLEHFLFRGWDREVRLFACAVCRHMFQFVTVNPWDRFAVEQAEQHADGRIGDSELLAASENTTSDWTAAFACREAASDYGTSEHAIYAACDAAHELADHVTDYQHGEPSHPDFLKAKGDAKVAQTALLRCIVGNPFRPVTFDSRWRTEHTAGLALRMYEDRDFAAMPILADALEEAGCDSDAVLTHCREPGPHARGCWVVDGILGKR